MYLIFYHLLICIWIPDELSSRFARCTIFLFIIGKQQNSFYKQKRKQFPHIAFDQIRRQLEQRTSSKHHWKLCGKSKPRSKHSSTVLIIYRPVPFPTWFLINKGRTLIAITILISITVRFTCGNWCSFIPNTVIWTNILCRIVILCIHLPRTNHFF